MFNSFLGVLKIFGTHILYLRNGFSNPQKSLVPETPIVLLPHDKLLELLEQIDTSRISVAVPLDSGENSLYTYGTTYSKYSELVESCVNILEKGHTLTKREVLEARIPAAPSTFFITDDGYFESPRDACKELFVQFKRLAVAVERTTASAKSGTVRHNLQVSGIMISDMITFVESTQIDKPIVSINSERNSRRSARGGMASDTV